MAREGAARVGTHRFDADRADTQSHRKRRTWPALVVVLSTGIISACSNSGTLTAGQSLAKAGQTAATQIDQNITLSSSALSGLQAAVAFNDGFNKQIGNSNSATFLANMAAIQRYQGQYDKLLQSLASSYVALGDLASYDASSTFNSSISSLASDTTKFAAALGKQITISSDVTSGVSGVGGFLVGSYQTDRVKDASAKIEVVLKQIIAILDDPTTQAKLIPVQSIVAGQIGQAAVTLLQRSIFSYGAILDELGSPMGLKSTPSSDAAVAKDGQVQAGLRNVAVGMVNAQTSSMAATYDKNLAALRALVPLHDSLQNNAPLNLTSISSVIGQLQSVASTRQPGKGT